MENTLKMIIKIIEEWFVLIFHLLCPKNVIMGFSHKQIILTIIMTTEHDMDKTVDMQ